MNEQSIFLEQRRQVRLLMRIARSRVADRVVGDSAEIRYVTATVLGGLQASNALASLGVRRFSNDDLRFRSSDTLFVLGSAPDINKLSKNHWEEISGSDSVGFNSWTRHPFAPTFFFAQYFSSDVAQRLASKDYKKTRIILRGDHIARQGLRVPGLQEFLSSRSPSTLRFMPEIPISRSVERISSSDALALLQAIGLWQRGTVPPLVPKFRSTIGLAVAFGYVMGYDKIVVCGSDPTTAGHFWDDHGVSIGSRFTRWWDYLRSDLWTHESRWFAPNTVSSYLRAIDGDLRELGGGGVYSGNVDASHYGLRSLWTS